MTRLFRLCGAAFALSCACAAPSSPLSAESPHGSAPPAAPAKAQGSAKPELHAPAIVDDGAEGTPQKAGAFPRAATTPDAPRTEANHAEVVRRVTAMSRDGDLRARVRRRGLDIVNVAWEDTARLKGSALGPNISDLTLQVQYQQGRSVRQALLPVIRFPNFTDRTADIKNSRFFVRAGNHKRGGALETVALSRVLGNLRGFLSQPASLKGSGSMFAARDKHFLVSAQAVFLPVPKQGKAEFVPAVFNYQSAPGSPAVLSILATRQGTSVAVIENRDDDASSYGGGQELYFNAAGKRARFTAERFKEVKARIDAQGGPKNEDERSAISRSADVIFLIQVPLVHRHRGYLGGLPEGGMGQLWGSGAGYGYGAGGLGLSGVGQGGGGIGLGSVGSVGHGAGSAPRSDMDRAVIGHGQTLGPFREARHLKLQRDARFPIRITVQFYKATSNGVVSDDDLAAIEKSIGSVYEHADYVGSLVVPEGDRGRPSEWQKVPGEWFPW